MSESTSARTQRSKRRLFLDSLRGVWDHANCCKPKRKKATCAHRHKANLPEKAAALKSADRRKMEVDEESADRQGCFRWEELRCAGQKPKERFLHTCVLYRRRLFVFGGRSGTFRSGTYFRDVHTFDVDKHTWALIERKKSESSLIEGDGPREEDDNANNLDAPQAPEEEPAPAFVPCKKPPRLCAHTAVACGDRMLVFGGSAGGARGDSLYAYHLEEGRWEKANTTGDRPSPRNAHSAVVKRGTMYVFGGADGGLKRLNDLYALSVEKRQWTRLGDDGDVPEPRAWASMAAHKNMLYIFGGYGTNHFNDLYAYDCDAQKWTKVQANGQVPSPRRGHSAATHDRRMFVFGGFMDTQIYLNDLYCYYFESNTWLRIETVGIPPPSRRFHSMVRSGDRMFVFGGDGYDPSTKRGGMACLNDIYCLHLGVPSLLELCVKFVKKHGMYKGAVLPQELEEKLARCNST